MSLRYRGRIISVNTFQIGKKNLADLIGTCECCGKELIGLDAVPHSDPYSDDVNNDNTPVVQCSDCDDERARDI